MKSNETARVSGVKESSECVYVTSHSDLGDFHLAAEKETSQEKPQKIYDFCVNGMYSLTRTKMLSSEIEK